MLMPLLGLIQYRGKISYAGVEAGAFDSGEWIVLLTLAITVLGAVVHILLSLWVYDDARKLLISTQDPGALIARPWVWLFATLVGGILTLAVYWMIHRSMLSPRVAHAADGEEAMAPSTSPAILEAKKKARRRRRRRRASGSTAQPNHLAEPQDAGDEPTES